MDTDAACGHGRRIDPDDCLALVLLGLADNINLAGVSTVFGNASLAVTDRTARELGDRLRAAGAGPIQVHRGSASAGGARAPAHEALREALAEGPLTILALGPLTNIAEALRGRPDLQANVTRLVAVMGRRRGHLFHPVEGGSAHSFLGHGPIFRDFNFVKDEGAAATLLAMRLPLTLVPYEAGRDVMVGEKALDRMMMRGGAARWVAQRSRAWLDYWQADIGLAGFYPFDLVAAAYVVEPSLLQCADAATWIGRDIGLLGFFGRKGLFMTANGEGTSVLYCPEVADAMAAWLMSKLAAAPHRAAPAP